MSWSMTKNSCIGRMRSTIGMNSPDTFLGGAIYRELQSYGVDVSCYDPEADLAEVKREHGIELLNMAPQNGAYVILAVNHRSLLKTNSWEKI